MILRYTGASAYNAPQRDAALSLGGFASSTQVPNDSRGNLFSDISYESVITRKSECRGFVLENTTGVNITDVLVGYKLPANPNFTVEIAFVTLDSAGQRMERLNSAADSPYVGEFAQALITDSADGSLNVGNMVAGAKLGVWLRRRMTGDLGIPAFATLDEEIEYYKAVTQASYDFSKRIQLILKYTTP